MEKEVQIYTLKEVAKLLRVSEQTVRNWLSAGIICPIEMPEINNPRRERRLLRFHIDEVYKVYRIKR